MKSQRECTGFKPFKYRHKKGMRKLVHELSQDQIVWLRKVYPLEAHRFI